MTREKGDLISRQAVLNGIAEWIADGYADSVADCSHISSLVSHLPSVENKREWIPVSERLPEKSGEYLIAIKDRGYTEISWFYPDDKKWSYRNVDVVAWANMPEPYKAESEE